MLDHIGYFGPIILAFMNVYYLFYRKAYLYAYLFFLFVNQYINKGLKFLIKEPRPQNQIPFLTKIDTIGVEKYCMPSGHTQSIFYSTTFLYLTTLSNYLFIISLFFCAITIYQRYVYKRHTLKQLGIGSLIGIIVGTIIFNITKHYIETKNSAYDKMYL